MAIKYSSDVPPASDRLARARAALSEASERVGAQVGKEAFKEAAVRGDRLKSEEVLARPSPTVTLSPGFDRAAWHKAYMKNYMKTYMQDYRARKRGAK